jgi:mono/diheme cytochrome c family protein
VRVIRWSILIVAAFLMALVVSGIASAQVRLAPPDQSPFPSTYVPSGEHLYKQFCSACHGVDAKGQGPAAASLKMPPPDLTTLAKRHMGKFPEEYVSSVLLFGPGTTAHGASDMPTWGPVFLYLDKHDEAAVKQRIKNLTTYLKSLQQQD